MGAPLGNKNGARAEGDKTDSFLHVRCTQHQKAQWVRAADGKKLSEWVLAKLDKAAKRGG